MNLSRKSILRIQAIGFSILLGVMFVGELLGLPQLVFGDPPEHMWTRIVLRTVAVLVICALVHFSTRRLLKRLHELEELLLICSWCRKVGHKGEWLTMEDYFDFKFQTETSHGICPECARKQLAQHHAAIRIAPPVSAEK